MTENARKDGFAVAALVLGIIALIVGLIPYVGLLTLFVLGPVAVIIGIVAMVRTKNDIRPGRRVARIGLVLGIAAMVVALIWVFVIGWAMDRFYSNVYGGGEQLTGQGGTPQTAIAFGSTSQYPNGMTVVAGPPVPAQIPADLKRVGGYTVGVSSTVTFANTSDEPIAWEPGGSFYYYYDNSACKEPEDSTRPPPGQQLAPGATQTITVTGYCYNPAAVPPIDGSTPTTTPAPATVSLRVLPAPYTYEVTWFTGPLPVN